ncbi:MAG: formate dehydrogenase subunit alpha [Deltaproteobacteria bacterium]|nr:formate dehydrogenase subunit alpha [Deltaproteobacteria bacterium]
MDQNQPTLRLNGTEVPFTPGQTILEVARDHGVPIPTLCYLKGATPTGACRMCLVEVKGARSLVASCAMPAGRGLEIATDSEAVRKSRKLNIELLLASGQHNCLTCEKNGECKLQALAYEYGIKEIRFEGQTQTYPAENLNPLIIRDFSRCILCGRCVQACNELQVNRAIGYGYRGAASKIVTTGDRPYDQSDCVFCGQCVQACPVGALTEKKAKGKGRPWETRQIRTTCPYCGVGCQMNLHVKDGRISKVTAVEEAQPNQGMLCVKGRFGYDFVHSPERLTTPLIKGVDGRHHAASWEEALDLVAGTFRAIREEHGPDALAGISSARSLNENSYNMQKLFRAVLGTNNLDHCARVCHAPTVTGLSASFGSGAMTNSFDEFARARLIFVIGSNPTEAHPVAAAFIKRAVLRGAQLIVADPRFTGLAEHAQVHLPLKVGSDVAFLNGLMQVIIAEGWQDQAYVDAHTEGFAELRAKVAEYPPERVAEISGISPELLQDTARRLAAVKPAMLVYTLGITEHTCGVNNVRSCANLQMLLGNVGLDCGGVNPLRGQNNVQGACDMGALPNVYPGYQAVADPAAREKFSKAWGATLPEQAGLMVPQMFEAARAGQVRGLWIFGENVANTEPDIRHVEHCLESVEFLVVSDIFPNETTRFADVILPAAGWSEDDGTYTNSERRVQRVRKAVDPPGQARPDWWIFREMARRLGQEWPAASGQEIWDHEISRLAPSLGGITFARLEGDGLQWPCPDPDHPGTTCLHRDGCFTCGRGRFAALDWTPPAEVPDAEYPLVLSTGRRLYHYHTRTQTGRSEGLNELLDQETADISPADALRLGIANGDLVRVQSRRGQVVVPARVTRQVPPGLVWMSFHFRKGNANWLTNPVYDPLSQTAEYKACAVQVSKA